MILETGVEIERAGAKEEVLVVVPIVGMIAIVTEDGVVDEDVGVVAMSIEEAEVEGTRIATGIVAAGEVVIMKEDMGKREVLIVKIEEMDMDEEIKMGVEKDIMMEEGEDADKDVEERNLAKSKTITISALG